MFIKVYTYVSVGVPVCVCVEEFPVSKCSLSRRYDLSLDSDLGPGWKRSTRVVNLRWGVTKSIPYTQITTKGTS